jgi:3-hydroxyacyl-CoA dehydrogenase
MTLDYADRRGAEEGARPVHAAGRRRPVEGAAPYLLRRARGRKVPGIGKDVQPREIKRAAVIGAGTMGGGISMNFANVGIPVTIIENNEDALKRGMATIEKNYQTSVQRGSLKPEDMQKRLSLFTPTTDLNALKDADIVIEAVFEEMPIKKELFGKIEKIAKPGAVLATNTSYLNVDEIAP